jgi:serine/threonine-protein phosphatase 6 regulatory subunit 3
MSWIEDFISKVLRAAKDPRGIYYSTEIEGFLRKMFWRVSGLSTKSPVESVLDKDVYSLEELLDEDDIIQECKSLNGRLINFLKGKLQVEALLHYVIDEPPENADNKQAFKFPFIACEIFTCEIDVILKTLVEDEEVVYFEFTKVNLNCKHGDFSILMNICFSVVRSKKYKLYVQESLIEEVSTYGLQSVKPLLNPKLMPSSSW